MMAEEGSVLNRFTSTKPGRQTSGPAMMDLPFQDIRNGCYAIPSCHQRLPILDVQDQFSILRPFDYFAIRKILILLIPRQTKLHFVRLNHPE